MTRAPSNARRSALMMIGFGLIAAIWALASLVTADDTDQEAFGPTSVAADVDTNSPDHLA